MSYSQISICLSFKGSQKVFAEEIQKLLLRRQIRERKEYLYRKSKEEQERLINERKQKVKQCLAENKPIPTELREEALELQKLGEYDTGGLNSLSNHQDDEYRWAGVEDPSLMVTTSHNPSVRLKEFAKELRLVFPNCQRINRGSYDLKQVIETCLAHKITDLLIVREHRGIPDGFDVCHLPYGPTAYFSLSNVVTRHDLPNVSPMSEAYPHLIFHNFSSKLGLRVKSILKYLFPVPKESSRRTMTFANTDDFISFRHHVYRKVDHKNIELSEVGPRFEMQIYRIRLGTIDQERIADVEWQSNSFLRTSRKRKILSNE